MPPVQDISAEIARAYRTAWERILAEQERIAQDPLLWRRRNRLRELQKRIGSELTTIEHDTARWAAGRLPKVYEEGATQAAAVGGLGDFSWTVPHTEAIRVAATDTYQAILLATSGVRASTKDLIRAVTKNELLQKLTVGATAVQTGKEITRQLIKDHGIFAIRYADGAKVGIDTYGAMVARTQSALAYNQGTLNQGKQFGVQFYEVFDGGGCGWDGHDSADIATGTIRTVDECEAFPISHPNCVRSFAPRPDIDRANLKDAQVLNPKSLDERARDVIDTRAREAAQKAKSSRVASRNARLVARDNKLAARAVKRGNVAGVEKIATKPARSLWLDAYDREPGLTSLVEELAAKHGGKPAGLDFRLKTEPSIKEKIVHDAAFEKPGITLQAAADSIKDVNRYTITTEAPANMQAVLDDLRSRGYQLTVKNTWEPPVEGHHIYKGVNVGVFKGAEKWELQLHTEESFYVKNVVNHKPYERWRTIGIPPAEVEALARQMAAAYADVRVPPGIFDVH